jgi:N-acetylmuramoyl-L-alanine amidase
VPAPQIRGQAPGCVRRAADATRAVWGVHDHVRSYIEPLFITDPFEGSIAASDRGQQVIAAGPAHAVEQYFAPPHSR